MPHHFQTKQIAARVFALVLVALLFCIAVLAAIYQDRNERERTVHRPAGAARLLVVIG